MKEILLFTLCLFSFGITFAQNELSKEEIERREKNIQAGNPFAEFGYKAKVATLSKGKYLEVHDLDSIVKIGSSYWHVKNQKIVGNLEQDTTDVYRQPLFETAGRWLSPDPLAEEFPEWSPYNYTMNNPIRFTDPTGLAPKDCCNGIIPGSWLGTAGYTLKRTSEVVSRKLSGESWASAYANTYQNDSKNVVRYATPVEDVYGVATGQDFDGNEYNRAEAGVWAATSFIPFAKLGKAIKIGSKQFDNLADFYKATSKLAVGERVAKYKEVGSEIAKQNNWTKNKTLSKKNNRDIFTDRDGKHYSLDTQHGHFEILNKRGQHQGSIDFDGINTGKGIDKTGKHDINIK